MVRIKRQKIRFRKKRLPFLRPSPIRTKAVIKFLMTGLIVCMIGIGLVKLKILFVDSEYFIVKRLDVKIYSEDGSIRELSLNKIVEGDILGANLFFVDLNDLKERIEQAHLEFKNVVVRRVLPNKLIVHAELRRGVAQIRSDRYYLVDKEGVLLPDVKNFPDPDLPIIIGIGTNLAKLPTSKFSKFERDKLEAALSLIQAIQAVKKLQGYKLKVVDVTDPGNLSFSLEAINVEIKIGKADFRTRLEVLTTVLDQLGSDVNDFKYIDLRFEDPIVGPQ